MSFNSFDNVVQTTTNSCGAFALAAALVNFDLADQTTQACLLNTADLKKGYTASGPSVVYSGAASAFAESIYQVTGNLLLGTDATYEYDTPTNVNMNPPSALVYVATLFGHPPGTIAVKYTGAGMGLFEPLGVTNKGWGANLFATEINLLSLIAGSSAMVIAGPMDYAGKPKTEGFVQIVLVNDGGHWLAISNNQLYNPGDGYVGNYQLAIDQDNVSFEYITGVEPDQKTNKYVFSGIWIELPKA